MLRRAAEMGNSLARSTLCFCVLEENEKEAFLLAQFAASQLERDGFYMLGYYCFRNYIGCEIDFNLASQNLLIAAELGNVDAAIAYGHSLDYSDPARWIWWGRAALHGFPGFFLGSFCKEVEKFFSGSGTAQVHLSRAGIVS